MNTLGLILLTYAPSADHPRSEYAGRTLQSALASLSNSGLSVHVHIASDGSAQDHVRKLGAIASMHSELVSDITVSDSERRGYGANFNAASQMMHWDHDVFLMLEDDWEANQPIDWVQYVGILREAKAGCIRLGYIGYTQELSGSFRYLSGEHFVELDPESPERHVWSGHPRLETREFQRRVGPWPEGFDPGMTEHIVAGLDNSRVGVLFPVKYLWKNAFVHIGTVQAREDQR